MWAIHIYMSPLGKLSTCFGCTWLELILWGEGGSSMFTIGHQHGVKGDRACGEQQSTQGMFCGTHFIPLSKWLSEIHLLTYYLFVSTICQEEVFLSIFRSYDSSCNMQAEPFFINDRNVSISRARSGGFWIPRVRVNQSGFRVGSCSSQSPLVHPFTFSTFWDPNALLNTRWSVTCQSLSHRLNPIITESLSVRELCRPSSSKR